MCIRYWNNKRESEDWNEELDRAIIIIQITQRSLLAEYMA